MATVTVTLRDGLKVGTEAHHEAELREATAGDVLDGTADAERLVQSVDGEWHLVQSPAMTALHILRRRIVRIGEFTGPFTPQLIRGLSVHDLDLLQAAANRLDAVSVGAALTKAGEPGADSPGP